MRKELICDIIQKSISYVDIFDLTVRNNHKFLYEKRYRFAHFESIRLTI